MTTGRINQVSIFRSPQPGLHLQAHSPPLERESRHGCTPRASETTHPRVTKDAKRHYVCLEEGTYSIENPINGFCRYVCAPATCDAPREQQWAQEHRGSPHPRRSASGLSLLRLSGFLVAGCLDNDAHHRRDTGSHPKSAPFQTVQLHCEFAQKAKLSRAQSLPHAPHNSVQLVSLLRENRYKSPRPSQPAARNGLASRSVGRFSYQPIH